MKNVKSITALVALAVTIVAISAFSIDKTNSMEKQNTIELSKEAEEILETRKEDFLGFWEEAKTYTLAVANAMPTDKYNTKTSDMDEVRTFAQQLKHLGWANNTILTYALKNQGFPEIDPELENKGLEKEEIIAFLTKSYDDVAKRVKEMSVEELNEKIVLALHPMEPKVTRYEYLDFLRDHGTHHRAQAVCCLRAVGITPPTQLFFHIK